MPANRGRFGPPEVFVARKATEPRWVSHRGPQPKEVSPLRDALLALCAYVVTIVLVTRR
jgi:hypothetical protein